MNRPYVNSAEEVVDEHPIRTEVIFSLVFLAVFQFPGVLFLPACIRSIPPGLHLSTVVVVVVLGNQPLVSWSVNRPYMIR
jgi:hypothetical protein